MLLSFYVVKLSVASRTLISLVVQTTLIIELLLNGIVSFYYLNIRFLWMTLFSLLFSRLSFLGQLILCQFLIVSAIPYRWHCVIFPSSTFEIEYFLEFDLLPRLENTSCFTGNQAAQEVMKPLFNFIQYCHKVNSIFHCHLTLLISF